MHDLKLETQNLEEVMSLHEKYYTSDKMKVIMINVLNSNFPSLPICIFPTCN